MTTRPIRPIRTLLVANRGEIACRIFSTARRMGIRTVAVHSEADADALHVRTADEAHLIGPAAARDSYLRIDRILEAAKASGADAIHPGYGFLSENAEFAEAVAAAGLIFVGPPASAIRAMGSKSAAKSLMETAGVPLVPGYHGADQDPELLAREATRIGYPVLIKASAGGGGKGMKVVERAEDFAATLASAKREAASSFGDDRVLIERYLTKPRHIEVQVFADAHGDTLHLFERDCSVQRRHQKVIEEAPAPGMTPERRAAMGTAAVEAARAVGYVGAGTVEFIAEGDDFFFMEMNTRLQVEHPVTEAITGEDLVEWQIRVARGEALPCRQEDLVVMGHAVEARLYAEDADRDFLPQTGRLDHLAFPTNVRIDAGVATGDVVSHHYDPMIAKLIAHGATREEALERLADALAATEVMGLVTNRAFLERILRHPEFVEARHDTGFIARNADALFAPAIADDRLAVLAALAVLEREKATMPHAPADPHSPWGEAGAWCMNLPARSEVSFRDGADTRTLAFDRLAGRTTHVGPEGEVEVAATLLADGRLDARLGATRLTARVVFVADRIAIYTGRDQASFTLVDPRAGDDAHHHHADRLVAPMPGSVVQVLVEAGATVAKGDPLVVVEAMKMEHVIRAPHDGVVERVDVAVGDVVADGTELAVMAAED
ncbi:acetyl/propionyl/methylcrotonyl-CoA carboxylase subunit alpha [Pinisolibacter sp.]|uniref:acetyl/propionyl/methylcrotonyl-CoA carboxylase subunit alpha n=1 Tax=Pinisolibacter sp. TaxID=2172024 RepID=UPI002FDED233